MHGRGIHGRGACLAEGACMAGETATTADGTHPTGMHSSYEKFLQKIMTFHRISKHK